MAFRDRIPAFLFGFAFQLTLVAMSFAGLGGRTNYFEIFIQRFADILSWAILPAGVASILILTRNIRTPGSGNSRHAAQRAWVVSFMCGIILGMAATAMGLSGGFWGPSTRWQRLSRQTSTAVVLILAYAGAAFCLMDTVALWRSHQEPKDKKSGRIAARLALAAVLLMYGAGNFLEAWTSGTIFATLILVLICLGSTLDLNR